MASHIGSAAEQFNAAVAATDRAHQQLEAIINLCTGAHELLSSAADDSTHQDILDALSAVLAAVDTLRDVELALDAATQAIRHYAA